MSLLKNVGTIGSLTLVSRIAGMAREMIFSRVLGANAVTDAWFQAFIIPNVFRRLFAEGAFSAAFVPMFSKRLHGHRLRPAHRRIPAGSRSNPCLPRASVCAAHRPVEPPYRDAGRGGAQGKSPLSRRLPGGASGCGWQCRGCPRTPRRQHQDQRSGTASRASGGELGHAVDPSKGRHATGGASFA